MIIIIITDLYSAFRSEDTEALIGLMLIYLLSIKEAQSPNYATIGQLVLRVFCAK